MQRGFFSTTYNILSHGSARRKEGREGGREGRGGARGGEQKYSDRWMRWGPSLPPSLRTSGDIHTDTRP